MEFGRRVMNERLDRGIRQQELAKACGVTPAAICKIESGEHGAKGQTALAIARHLGVTLEYLLDESGPYPYEPPKKPDTTKDGMVTVRLTLEEKALIEALPVGSRSGARSRRSGVTGLRPFGCEVGS